MIEHCISALYSKINDELFRCYVTDALKVIAENTARFNSGSHMKGRYADITVDRPTEEDKEKEERTAQDVINGLREKMRKL